MGAKTHVEDSPLGFGYSPCSFTTDALRDIRAVCFQVRKVLEGIVYDTVALEDNPFTLPEVKTLIEGVTVGGHKVSDANQVLNQAASWRALLRQVEKRRFVLAAENACAQDRVQPQDDPLLRHPRGRRDA